MDEPSGSCPVLTAWTKLDAVVQRVAGKGVMLDASGKLTRQSCVDNADILKPVIENLGGLTVQARRDSTLPSNVILLLSYHVSPFPSMPILDSKVLGLASTSLLI